MVKSPAKKGSLVKKLYQKHKGSERKLIPDGTYVAQLRNLSIKDDADKPSASLLFVVQRGEMKGQQCSAYYGFYDLSGEKNGKKWEINGEETFVNFMQDMAELGFNTDELDLEDLIEAVKEERPLARVKIKLSGQYNNVNILSGVDDDDDDDDDAPFDEEEEELEDEGDEEEVDEEEEEDVEEDDAEEDEEDEEPSIEKGDEVMAKPRGTKKMQVYTVKTVNNTKQTCTLVRSVDGKTFSNVPFDVIEVDEE